MMWCEFSLMKQMQDNCLQATKRRTHRLVVCQSTGHPLASVDWSLANFWVDTAQDKYQSMIPNLWDVGWTTGRHLVHRLTLPRQCLDQPWVLLVGPFAGPFRSCTRKFQMYIQLFTIFRPPTWVSPKKNTRNSSKQARPHQDTRWASKGLSFEHLGCSW